jgi:hypothetical protein
MSKKMINLLLVFSVCLNIGFLAVAGVGFFKHRMDPRPFSRAKKFSTSVIFKSVDLNPQQKEELERLEDLLRAHMLSIKKTSSPLRIKMMQRLAEPSQMLEPDQQEITAEIKSIHSKRDVIIQEHFQAVRRVLSDEQARVVFERFAEIQRKWAGRIKSPRMN